MYNIGDKVLIKSLDWYNSLKDEYNEIVCYNEEDFEFPFTSGEFFTESMTRYCGCVARIEDIEIGRYKLDIDGNQNFWTDDMIERLVESASVREFRLPPDDDDKLATEVRKGGVSILPPYGYLIGKITDVEGGMLVEFVKK